MTDLDLTLAAVALHGWHVVLLGKQSKRPIGKTWDITADLDVIQRHYGNRGLLCGPESGVAVLDFDSRTMAEEMRAELGPIKAWARSGSGLGEHCYVSYQPELPAKIMWRGIKAGEIQRGGIGPDGPVLQQVVLSPAIHPGDPKKGIPPGGIYRWLIDPRSPLPTLPDSWRAYLNEPVSRPDAPPLAPAPAWIPNDTRGLTVENDLPWDGPPATELLRRALSLTGASRRAHGVKFQCPGCRAEGHDAHEDNAIVRNDGRFGCAFDEKNLKNHRRAIAIALGVTSGTTTPIVVGHDARILRRLGAFRL